MSEQHTVIDWQHRLPELEPPPTLWPRVLEARRRERRMRILAPAVAAAVACVGLALALLVAPPATPPPMAALDSLIEDNRRLAAALEVRQGEATALHAWQRARIRSLEIDLSLLERRLQAGYSSAASNHELESLWRARAGLLSHLIESYERPRDIRSI
ncbi:MAG TPA: hypothetical protein PKZ76_09325 [Xanthomonadaceae bacterium]|nr:hypothetical protein [Xanthomonadaceae bacterium]